VPCATIHLSPVTLHTAASIPATRTVILDFNHFANAKILKSTIKFATEKQ
jgi:hypothetical protein